MKLHVFLAICSQNKTAAISLAVLVSSVIGGGFYVSTPDGQNAIRNIVQPLPLTAAQAPLQEPVMTLTPSVKAEAKITIAQETNAALAAVPQTQYVPKCFVTVYNMYPAIFTKADGTLVFGKGTITAPTTDTTTPTTVPTATETAAETAAQTAVPTTVQTAAPTTAQTKAPKTARKAALAAATEAPAAATEAPAATTAVPAATTAAPAAPAALGDASGSFKDDMAYAILDLVNAQRAAAGLPALTWNDTLADSAKIRSTEIVVKWAHTRPDGSAWYTAGSQMEMGENLAFGQTSTQQVMDEWMASSGHAENILRSTFTQIGVSCYYCNGTYYWAQHFA